MFYHLHTTGVQSSEFYRVTDLIMELQHNNSDQRSATCRGRISGRLDSYNQVPGVVKGQRIGVPRPRPGERLR